MLDTYILKIEKNINRDEFTRLLRYVSEEKRERINRFYRFDDAQRTLLGDVLARYAICKRLGISNRDLHFSANRYGKPILLEPNGIHFNISHSGNWVVCAVDDAAVGTDVELIKPIDFKIAENFFAEEEYISLISQPEEMRMKYFYKIWTLKESYIKMEGKGLSIPLDSFTIRVENNKINVTTGNKIQEFCFYQSFLDSETIYTVCTQNSNISESIRCSTESFDLLRSELK